MKESYGSSYNNTFMYPENGAMSFLNKMYNNLDKTRVKLNTSIESINYENKTAITSNDEEIQYEYLINTIPLNHFLNLFFFHIQKPLLLIYFF